MMALDHKFPLRRYGIDIVDSTGRTFLMAPGWFRSADDGEKVLDWVVETLNGTYRNEQIAAERGG